MSIIVNIGVLMWIVAISFFAGMIVGTVIMVHAFSKGKKNMPENVDLNMKCENDKSM